VTIHSTVGALLDAISDAFALTSTLDPPSTSETLTDLHQRLLICRAAMTRVADLTGELTLLSGKVKRLLIEAKGELEDEEAALVGRKPRHTEDFSSAKERNARMAAGTLETLRKIRKAEGAQSEVDSALFYARDRHRELDRAVRDIDTRLRIISIESHIS
jgi:hypothetical protein